MQKGAIRKNIWLNNVYHTHPTGFYILCVTILPISYDELLATQDTQCVQNEILTAQLSTPKENNNNKKNKKKISQINIFTDNHSRTRQVQYETVNKKN